MLPPEDTRLRLSNSLSLPLPLHCHSICGADLPSALAALQCLFESKEGTVLRQQRCNDTDQKRERLAMGEEAVPSNDEGSASVSCPNNVDVQSRASSFFASTAPHRTGRHSRCCKVPLMCR